MKNLQISLMMVVYMLGFIDLWDPAPIAILTDNLQLGQQMIKPNSSAPVHVWQLQRDRHLRQTAELITFTDIVLIIVVTCQRTATLEAIVCNNPGIVGLCYEEESFENKHPRLKMTSCPRNYVTPTDIVWHLLIVNSLQNVLYISDNNVTQDGKDILLQTLSCHTVFSPHLLNLTSHTVYPLPLVLNVIIDCPQYNATQALKQTWYHISGGHRSVVSRPTINWFVLALQGSFDQGEVGHLMFRTDTLYTITSTDCSWHRSAFKSQNRLNEVLEIGWLDFTRCMEYIVSQHVLDHVGNLTGSVIGHASSYGDVSGLKNVQISGSFTDFKGEHFYVATHDYFPFSYPVNGDVYNATRYTGYAIEVMDILAQKHNFTFSLKYSRDHLWGGIGADGCWNGLVGMVRDGDADLTATGLTITPQRLEAVDFTVPFWGLVNGILIHTVEREWFPFIRPFQSEVWLAYLGCGVFTTISLWLVLVVYRYHIPSCTSDTWLPLHECALFIFGVTFLRSGEYNVRTGSTRFLIGSFWILVLVVTATYSGNLMASLATEQHKLPFTTLAQLANQDEFVLVMRDATSAAGLLKDATSGPYYTLWSKLMENPQNLYQTWGDMEAHMRTGKYATISDKIELSMRIVKLGCNYRVLPDEFTPSGYGVALLKGSPFTRVFSNTITQALEGGMGRKWQNMFWPDDLCAEEYKVSAKSKPTSLRSLYGLLILLTACLGLAILVLLVEILYKNPEKQHKGLMDNNQNQRTSDSK